MTVNAIVHFFAAVGLIGLFWWLKKTEDQNKLLKLLVKNTSQANTGGMLKVQVGKPVQVIGNFCELLDIEFESMQDLEEGLKKVSLVSLFELYLRAGVSQIVLNKKNELQITVIKKENVLSDEEERLSSSLQNKCSII